MTADDRPHDILRQVAVIAATVFMLIAAAVGSGALGGTPVDELQDGALAADGSYLAPAGPAFSIWSVIYVGLIGYALWQALPRRRADERQRAVGWWIALSEILNGLWLVTAQFTVLGVTVVTIFALLAVLAFVFRRLVRLPGRGGADAVLVDGVTGLHLGWVTLASVANVTAWLTQIAPAAWESGADAWGLVVLTVVAILGCGVGWISGGRLAPACALVWGLAWLAMGRLAEQPESAVIGIAAIVVAVLVLVVTVFRRLRRQGQLRTYASANPRSIREGASTDAASTREATRSNSSGSK